MCERLADCDVICLPGATPMELRALHQTAPASGQLTTKQVLEREHRYGAHNYHPLPVAICRAKGEQSPAITLLRRCNSTRIFPKALFVECSSL